MSEHTPGPWTVSPNRPYHAMAGDDYIVADCAGSGDRNEAIANARLIAATLELLAACKQLVNACESIEEQYESDTVEYKIAHRAANAGRAAIAKATA